MYVLAPNTLISLGIALTIPETRNDPLNYFSLEEMTFMIQKAGLTIVKQEKLLGYTFVNLLMIAFRYTDSENGSITYYRGFLLTRL